MIFLYKSNNISNSVIRRLPRYYRFLGQLLKQNITKISSRELSEKMRLTASQIRQDLNCFGGFGQQGYGYNVEALRDEIAKIIGIDKQLKAILIGAGNLGRAITMHLDFEKNGCHLIGIFDNNLAIEDLQIANLPITHTNKLKDFCLREKPDIAILCIPRAGTKELVQTLIDLNIKSFWNFSHYDINLEFDDIIVENVHLGDSLLTLSYNVNNRPRENNS